MKIHPDWNNNGSVAITFDDEDDDASETYGDFSKFLNLFNVKFTTFKLKGSKTASMVIPINIPTEDSSTHSTTNVDIENAPEVNSTERTDETRDDDDTVESTDSVVIKKKKKKVPQ
jgi:hypothetical protein